MSRFRQNVLAVAYREARVMLHDRAFLMALLVQPVIMLGLYGGVISNQPANVPWAVIDRSQTALSRRLVEDVQSTGYFLPPRRVAGYAEARALLRRQSLLAVLIVPGSFRRDAERGHPRVQLLLDGSDPLAAARVGGYVAQVAAAFAVRREPPAAPPDGPPGRAGAIDVRQRFWFNPTLRDRDFFLATIAGMLLTNISLSLTGASLVGEREMGTYEFVLSLPTSALEIVLGKLLPAVAVAYGLLLVALVGSGLCYGFWPAGSWLALFAVTLPFVLASLSVGVLVSTFARTSAQAVFLSTFFILPSFVLSGVGLPYQLMPHGVRELGGLFPLRWYQIASRRIIERGAGFGQVVVPTLMLGLFFAVMLALVRWRMKPRLG
ncbi:MAG TPA: ABC transporter permease [Candidatus Binatia bacterium]|nr:ABC transporter permease [Candidatus Binatia bacterium]